MKSTAKGSFKDFYELVIFLSPEIRGFLLLRVFLSFLYEGLKLIPVYLVKLIVDDVFQSPHFSYDATLVGTIFGLLILIELIDIYAAKHGAIRIAYIQQGLLERIHRKLLQLPIAFHERQVTGALVTKINKAANYISEFLFFAANEIIPTLLQIVLTSLLLIYTSWRLSLIYLICLPLILWMISNISKKTQPYREAYHIVYDAALGELAQSLYNIKTVKDYAQEEHEHKTYSELLSEYVEKIIIRFKYEFNRILARDIFSIVARGGTMLLAVWFVINGQLTPGDLVLVFTLLEKVFLNTHRLGRIYNLLGDAHESLTRARTILEERNSLTDPSAPKHVPSRAGTITFSDVDFSYGAEPVLKKVDFTIPAKSVVAIVGASGAGKSTVIKLLTRHYDPIKGKVLLDGVDLRELSMNEVRRRIAIVSQHTEIFNRTVQENIAYAKHDATRKEVVDIAKKANAHGFIMSFRQGYDTLVGEKGVRLSGGQQQRISIARALLANPDILVFDEATSSLDSESEAGIQKALFSARGKYTMVIIAHRLSTVEHADLVIVLEDGRVAEIGSQSELLTKKDSLYKKMRALQRLGELRE